MLALVRFATLLGGFIVWGWTFSANALTFPTFEQLDAGAHRIRPLPGQREFVFTLYGTPGELESLRQLVEVMQTRHLGNGFDPGPVSYTHLVPSV